MALIGIIYNWKGLKEENYIYTIEEMKEFDPEILEECMKNPEGFAEGAFTANKTYTAFLIQSDCDIKNFLNGKYNNSVEEMASANECSPENYSDWYWANERNNNFYGYQSETMEKLLEEFKIVEEHCQ